jgi:ABC-type multidrug transport system fused ATPase/permease subunit
MSTRVIHVTRIHRHINPTKTIFLRSEQSLTSTFRNSYNYIDSTARRPHQVYTFPNRRSLISLHYLFYGAQSRKITIPPASMAPTTDLENLPKEKQPIVISGPSGSGKSTIITKLREKHPGRFGFSCSRMFFPLSLCLSLFLF